MSTNTFTMRSRLSFSVSSSFRNSSNASNIASWDVINFSLAICAPISLAIAYQKQGGMEDGCEDSQPQERSTPNICTPTKGNVFPRFTGTADDCLFLSSHRSHFHFVTFTTLSTSRFCCLDSRRRGCRQSIEVVKDGLRSALRMPHVQHRRERPP